MESNKQKAGDFSPWWVFLPIIAAPVLLFLPALWPGRSLFWGITSIQFIPWHWEALRSLQAGEIPLWNTLNGMGAPLAANYQSALFYPPTWLTLLAGWLGGLQGMSWSHGLLIVLHLIWAGWGMKKLTEFLGLSPIPQVICGLSYSLCGYLVARGSFLTMVQAASWIPWILYAASQFAMPVRGITVCQQIENCQIHHLACTCFFRSMVKRSCTNCLVYPAFLSELAGCWSSGKRRDKKTSTNNSSGSNFRSSGLLTLFHSDPADSRIFITKSTIRRNRLPDGTILFILALAGNYLDIPRHIWQPGSWQLLGICQFLGRCHLFWLTAFILCVLLPLQLKTHT